jgi:hypothetical protein
VHRRTRGHPEIQHRDRFRRSKTRYAHDRIGARRALDPELGLARNDGAEACRRVVIDELKPAPSRVVSEVEGRVPALSILDISLGERRAISVLRSHQLRDEPDRNWAAGHREVREHLGNTRRPNARNFRAGVAPVDPPDDALAPFSEMTRRSTTIAFIAERSPHSVTADYTYVADAIVSRETALVRKRSPMRYGAISGPGPQRRPSLTA